MWCCINSDSTFSFADNAERKLQSSSNLSCFTKKCQQNNSKAFPTALLNVMQLIKNVEKYYFCFSKISMLLENEIFIRNEPPTKFQALTYHQRDINGRR